MTHSFPTRRSSDLFDHYRDNRLYVAPALSFVPDDSTNITLLAQYFRNVSRGSTQSFPASGTIDPNPNGQIPRNFVFGDPGWDRTLTENRSIDRKSTRLNSSP